MSEVIEELKRDVTLDYLKILKALKELPFNVGKNLLVDFLAGDYKNKSIINNKLDELYNFGSLNWEKERILSEINHLINNGMIEQITSDYNRFIKVLRISIKGQNEITRPTLPNLRLKDKINFGEASISLEEREMFEELSDFLGRFDDQQKKAIISNAKKILCIAGAGSGKTTALTKRIEFLVKYKNVLPEKILAITFTRKARLEMEKRLKAYGILGVKVHTFNSFCERILQRNFDKIYGRPIRVLTYADKILAMNMALSFLGIDMNEAIERYFSAQQRKFKTAVQLQNSFLNDCFSVMEYFKLTNEEVNFSSKSMDENVENARLVFEITKYLKDHMDMQGLRDFSDQLIDAVSFLKTNKELVPSFEHVLVDEYQDVNSIQIELLKILSPKNIFAVGDPRQSIFGWRGSDISYILNFEKDYPESEIIHLTKNYRSSGKIVEFMNRSIKDMGLPDLESHRIKDLSKIKIFNFENEEIERIFVIDEILSSSIPRNQIFVLARTNRQLMELSSVMKLRKIPHILKTDDTFSQNDAGEEEITLATIHAIKGLQAKKVFVIGCNENNFPCKASDHPAIEMIKTDKYDKEEEERRLFYVAISRAKEILYLTYTGKKPTYFINEEMSRLGN